MSVVSDIFFATMRQKHQEVYYAETHPTLHHNDLSLFRDVASNNEIPLITSAYFTFCELPNVSIKNKTLCEFQLQ